MFEVAIPTVPMFTHVTFCGVVTTVTPFDVDCLTFRKVNYPQFCNVIVVVQTLSSDLGKLSREFGTHALTASQGEQA